MTVGRLDHPAEHTGRAPFLGPTASTRERIEGLSAIGLTHAELANALGVDPRTLRNWSAGRSEPSRQPAMALDDLRAAAAMLLEHGVKPRQVSAWLATRNPRLDSERPVDVILSNAKKALAGLADALARVGEGPFDPPSGEGLGDKALTASPILGPDGQPLNSDDPAYGRIEVAFRGISAEVVQRLAEAPHLMREMHWRDFEELVAELFHRNGFEVELTPAGSDSGVDLFAARRDELGTMLYAVECKRYTRPIGPDFVRQLAWVVERHRTTGGVLATTSRFTRGAVEEQRQLEFRMSLADYTDLRAWLQGRAIR